MQPPGQRDVEILVLVERFIQTRQEIPPDWLERLKELHWVKTDNEPRPGVTSVGRHVNEKYGPIATSAWPSSASG